MGSKGVLTENEELFIGILQSNFEKYRSDFYKNLSFGIHPRIPTMLALLKIGFSYLLEFSRFYGVFTLEEKELFEKEFESILIILASKHSEFSFTDKPTVKFISILKDMIAGRAVKVIEIDTSPDNLENKPLIGYYDDNYYYFIPKVTHNQVCSFYSRQGENFPTSLPALLKQLAEEEFIKSEAGRNTPVKRINHKIRSRFIHFSKNKFDNFGCMNENEVTDVTDDLNDGDLPF
jgi:hypothetical protein